VKQNPLEAKRAPVAVGMMITLVLSSGGCVRRPRMKAHANPQLAITNRTRLDINTATARDLERLPGVGRVIAERIVEHRTEHGAFRRVEHVMTVRGISERKFRAIAALITVQRTP